MNLLYTMLGLHLVFRTRLGCTLFAVLGVAATVAILANGKPTATGVLLLAATGYAAKRALKR
jgi:hypothetical protein